MSEDPTGLVLLVDDEPTLVEVMSESLRSRGYGVRVAVTGEAAIESVAANAPDLVVLDLGLPDADGVVVCRELRRWFPNPIVVLTADGAEDRKIEALDAGADDYVTKPFSTPELLARIRVALRHRKVLAAVVDHADLVVGDLELDLNTHEASVGGEPMVLTRKEFALLVLLARNAGRVMVHSVLLEHAWGPRDRGTPESLRVHLTHLRKKLGSGPERPRIETEPGVGYRLVLPGAER
jgi:two-component system KDP operon response regulator KdpE